MRLKNDFRWFVIILFIVLSFISFGQKVTFPSGDGLTISADLYQVNDTLPYIILCHLSEHSRGEYIESAPVFNRMGFNCLAIDTRTGNEINGIINETAREAMKWGKPNDFLSSEQDIRAAIQYLHNNHGPRGIVLLGSSFSASLVIKIGVDEPGISAVVAFSPGEYLKDSLTVKEYIKRSSKPLFITSSRQEATAVSKLLHNLSSNNIHQFVPHGEGAHGSISLWTYNPNHEEYWNAIREFLLKLYPKQR